MRTPQEAARRIVDNYTRNRLGVPEESDDDCMILAVNQQRMDSLLSNTVTLLVRVSRRLPNGDPLREVAMSWLHKNGLNGSPLRQSNDDPTEPAP